MEEGKTFEPNYVFFTNSEKALNYFIGNEIELNQILIGAIEGDWYERIPACYHTDTKETYVFSFNRPVKARIMQLLHDTIGIVPDVRKALQNDIASYFARHYVSMFVHEYVHEILDRLVGDEHTVFRNPSIKQLYAIDELVSTLDHFDEYKGPFTEVSREEKV